MKVKSKIQTDNYSLADLDKASFKLSTLDFKLSIGYDGKRAANNLTGLGNYSRSLITHLAKQFSENLYLVYTPKIKSNIEKLSVFSLPNVKLEFPTEGKSKLFWRSNTLVGNIFPYNIKF